MSKIYGIPVATPMRPGQSEGGGANGKSAYELAVSEGYEGTLEEWLASLKGPKGDPGKRGDDGKTPVKGEDYFTPEEIQEIAEQAAELVDVPGGGGSGEAGADGGYYVPNVSDGVLSWEPSKSGMPAVPDANVKGEDGYTPVKGTDYFTEDEVQEIAERAAGMVDVPGGGGTGESIFTELHLTDGVLTMNASKNGYFSITSDENIVMKSGNISVPIGKTRLLAYLYYNYSAASGSIPANTAMAVTDIETGIIYAYNTLSGTTMTTVPYVKTINGTAPDANGNIAVEGGSGGSDEVFIIPYGQTPATDAFAAVKEAYNAGKICYCHYVSGNTMWPLTKCTNIIATFAGIDGDRKEISWVTLRSSGWSSTGINLEKTSSITESSTDETPTAKAVYDAIQEASLEGKDGEDGHSPVVTATKSGTVTSIKVDGVEIAKINDGANGQDGAKGDKGDTGPQGEQGPKGDKGDTGSTGPQGEKGDKGDKGDTGSTGSDGAPGANGKDGVSVTHSWSGTTLTVTSASGTSSSDLKGEKGDTGAKGDQGEQGIQGVQGEKGDKGEQGLIWRGEWNSGTSYAVDDAVYYNGSAYFCIAKNSPDAPDVDTDSWELLASKGEQGIQGEPGLNWRGEWDDSTQYRYRDAVYHNGSAYIHVYNAVGANAPEGIEPGTDETAWQLLASKGTNGTNGTNGTSVTVKSVSESTADGGSNVVTFSDGKTVTIKNGSKGSNGSNGVDGKTPVKGTDYFTAADKAEMVNAVIAALPVYAGEVV